MSMEEFDEKLILVTGLWFLFKFIMFTAIWLASRYLMRGLTRTKLSRAQHGLIAGLVMTSVAIGTSFFLRYIGGDGPNTPIEPLWFRIALRGVLIAGLVVTTVYGMKVLIALWDRIRKRLTGIPDPGEADHALPQNR